MLVRDVLLSGVKLFYLIVTPLLCIKLAEPDQLSKEFKEEWLRSKLQINLLEARVIKLEANQKVVSIISPEDIVENTPILADYSFITGIALFCVCLLGYFAYSKYVSTSSLGFPGDFDPGTGTNLSGGVLITPYTGFDPVSTMSGGVSTTPSSSVSLGVPEIFYEGANIPISANTFLFKPSNLISGEVVDVVNSFRPLYPPKYSIHDIDYLSHHYTNISPNTIESITQCSEILPPIL